MIRTQIQLPDKMYRDAKRLAQDQEITLAEVIRRGLEHMIRLYPPDRATGKRWQLPKARHLGPFQAPADDWRELANPR